MQRTCDAGKFATVGLFQEDLIYDSAIRVLGLLATTSTIVVVSFRAEGNLRHAGAPT